MSGNKECAVCQHGISKTHIKHDSRCVSAQHARRQDVHDTTACALQTTTKNVASVNKESHKLILNMASAVALLNMQGGRMTLKQCCVLYKHTLLQT